jgi:hypothetical protein
MAYPLAERRRTPWRDTDHGPPSSYDCATLWAVARALQRFLFGSKTNVDFEDYLRPNTVSRGIFAAHC